MSLRGRDLGGVGKPAALEVFLSTKYFSLFLLLPLSGKPCTCAPLSFLSLAIWVSHRWVIGELHLFLICIDMVDFEPWVEMMMMSRRRRRRSRAIGTRAAVGGSVVSHRPPLCLRAQLTPHSTSLLAIRTQALAQTQYHPEVYRVLCNRLDQSTVVSAKELVSWSTLYLYISYLMCFLPPMAWRSQRSHRNISFVLRCVVLYMYLYLYCGFSSNWILPYFPLSVCPCVCHRRDISHFSHI